MTEVPLCVFAQVITHTPDSVFTALEYLKEVLILFHRNYMVPALTYLFELLQRAWSGLQESCKSVPSPPHGTELDVTLR